MKIVNLRLLGKKSYEPAVKGKRLTSGRETDGPRVTRESQTFRTVAIPKKKKKKTMNVFRVQKNRTYGYGENRATRRATG
jgi:hypothetical protein